MITSGGSTTMENKLIVAVCGYPELYYFDTTSYFYKSKFASVVW